MNVRKKHLRPVHLAPWVTTASVKFTANVRPREDKRATFPAGGKLMLDMSFPSFIAHARKRQQRTSNATDKCELLEPPAGSRVIWSSVEHILATGYAAERAAQSFFCKMFEHISWGLGLGFHVEVDFRGLPVVADLCQERADQPEERGFIGKHSGHAGAPFELSIDPFQSVGGA